MIELDAIRKLAFPDPVPFEIFKIYGLTNWHYGAKALPSFKEKYKDMIFTLEE